MIICKVEAISEYMEEVEKILIKMASLFQMQDDYIDVWGDPKITGKLGTDISDGKCTWLVIKSLENASKEQKYLLEKYYGQQNFESVKIVKEIFEKLSIKNHFQNEKIKIISEIKKDIENFKRKNYPLKGEIFDNILSKINSHFRNE